MKRLYFTGNAWLFVLRPILVLAAVCALVAWAFSGTDGSLWASMALSKGGQHATYCEQNQMNNVFRQPANAWSNMIYLLYGLFCMEFSWHDRKQLSSRNIITMFPLLSLVWGVSFAYLCFGSFFFHASLTLVGQRWDMAATYALMVVPLIILLWQTYNRLKAPNHLLNRAQLKKQLPAILVLIVALDVLFYIFKWDIDSHYMLPGMIIAVIILLIFYRSLSRSRFLYGFGALALISIIAAFTIWTMDRNKQWCYPESLFQGHAIWHVLTGLGSFSVYLLIRSEDSLSKETN